ncbi:MAG: NYN domain-containing protein [Gammaproteobacteria bacterium]|nr:NYN domain-containing protein [Gammaproteobacteria bacterium]MCP5200905.1 NYN domain-containing protein [Gammaproteobacteria bacterium]
MTRIALFADVQNVYYTTRERYGRAFDYRALWARVAATGDIVAARAYATTRGDPGQQRFQRALEHIGFGLRLKPYIRRADGSAKGDWDVGITIDVLDWAPQVDCIVLLSGDGDFALLLDTVRARHGVVCQVYGVPGLTARDLIAAADAYHPIGPDLLLD